MRKALIAPVVAVTLLAACGGEDSTNLVTTASTATDSAAPNSTNPDDGLPNFGYDGGTFITVFQDNDIFSTLLKVVTEAELTELLDGEGPYTFFAPVDKAFADLPDGTLEKLLLPENRETLLEILKYHLVEANLPTLEMPTGNLASLQGSPIAVEVFETSVFSELLKVNGKFSLLPNMEATNGTIHVINWIMLPPGIDLNTL